MNKQNWDNYFKEYREKNKEKLKIYHKNYYNKNRRRILDNKRD